MMLIERYLDDTMTAAERAGFEERLTQDEDLRDTIKDLEFLVEGIRYSARNELLMQLQELESLIATEVSEEEKETKVVPMYSRTWMSVAAAIALVLVSVLAYQIWPDAGSNEVAMADRYIQQHFPSEYSATRSAAEEDVPTPNKAYYLYEGGNYAAAASLFLQILEKEENPDMLFYAANSLLKVGDYQQSIDLFEELKSKFPKYEYSCEASFMQALGAIKLQRKQEAIIQLEQVAVCDDSTIANNARALIDALQ